MILAIWMVLTRTQTFVEYIQHSLKDSFIMQWLIIQRVRYSSNSVCRDETSQNTANKTQVQAYNTGTRMWSRLLLDWIVLLPWPCHHAGDDSASAKCIETWYRETQGWKGWGRQCSLGSYLGCTCMMSTSLPPHDQSLNLNRDHSLSSAKVRQQRTRLWSLQSSLLGRLFNF